jgi:predicted metal-dependent HD superfamily phosphohydrolase
MVMAPSINWPLRWQHLWSRLGLDQTDRASLDQGLDELQARYSEPHRAYHTLQHLADCLHHFDEVRHLARTPGEVETAIWFHDVIYEPRRNDNEEASAQWAEQTLAKQGVATERGQRVAALIRLTDHVTEPAGSDGALLLDIDLAILGADPIRFAEYEAQVRQEYVWVPWPAFRQARARILERFLQRPTIYRTAFFQTRFEAQARQNLAASLQLLNAE